MSKNLLTYSIIILLILPIFGMNFIINFIGNIFLLIILVPIFLLIIAILVLTTLKKNSQVCTNCGLTTIGNSEKCIYCGEYTSRDEIKKNTNNIATDKIIEIEAEEIK